MVVWMGIARKKGIVRADDVHVQIFVPHGGRGVQQVDEIHGKEKALSCRNCTSTNITTTTTTTSLPMHASPLYLARQAASSPSILHVFSFILPPPHPQSAHPPSTKPPWTRSTLPSLPPSTAPSPITPIACESTGLCGTPPPPPLSLRRKAAREQWRGLGEVVVGYADAGTSATCKPASHIFAKHHLCAPRTSFPHRFACLPTYLLPWQPPMLEM